MPKRQNIEISDAAKRRVELVAKIRDITLREASEEAWEAWLSSNEKNAIAKFERFAKSGRRVAVA